MQHIKGYVTDLLLIGTYYKRLYQFAFNHSVEDHLRSKGLVFEVNITFFLKNINSTEY